MSEAAFSSQALGVHQATHTTAFKEKLSVCSPSLRPHEQLSRHRGRRNKSVRGCVKCIRGVEMQSEKFEFGLRKESHFEFMRPPSSEHFFVFQAMAKYVQNPLQHQSFLCLHVGKQCMRIYFRWTILIYKLFLN